ncbi:MAG: F0F1 ATP synthase subunit alpha [Saccharofermentanales bacterium]
MADIAYSIIRIISPTVISEEKLEILAAKFAEKLKIAQYSYKLEIDESLLGGLVVYAGGYRYDYSIKGQLARIVTQLKTSKTVQGEAKTEDEIAKLINDTLSGSLSDFKEKPIAAGEESLFKDTTSLRIEDESKKTVVERLFENFSKYDVDAAIDEVGTVISVGDGIAIVTGVTNCKNNELIMFNANTFGIAMNLEESQIGVVLLGNPDSVYEGMICKRTGRTINVPVGKGLLGRVLDPLGVPIDGQGPLSFFNKREIEGPAPGIIDRQRVNKSLHTGIIAIDSMIPIGRGQRELIIGDRQTGKTAIAIDAIINQKGKNVYCVYVAIGQKMSNIVSVADILRKEGALNYTTIVAASASSSASLQYIAPYSGCAMAEELMYNENADVLIVYDDLTKHAQAYRAISLLLRRPPGREAYPGDVFYLHSRLLERAARLSDKAGGGSMTALPIIETQGGDISAYIPTNAISITDGQIYLESELFFSGQRPAINVGLSVSRVGGSAQSKAMKETSGSLRINLAQYRELEAFSQFGSDLDASTRSQLTTGRNLYEILKQPQYHPISMEKQVIILYLANTNKFCTFDKEDIKPFFELFVDYLTSIYPQVLTSIRETNEFTQEMKDLVNKGFGEYYQLWEAEHEEYGTDL